MATTKVISGEAHGVQPVDPATHQRTGTLSGKPRTAHERARMQAEERSRKRRRRFVVILLCAIALCGVAGYAAWNVLSSRPQTRDVPNLLNMTEEAARDAIEETDFFAMGDKTTEYSDTVAAGLVLEQDPDSGRTMPRNTKINIVVSLGERPKNEVTVPDLRNKTVTEAQQALESLGLTGKAGDAVFDDEVESGKVAKQSPEAGAAAKEGDVVTYQTSKGAEDVEIPEVVGSYESDAVAQLEDLGFVVSKTYGKSDYYDEGIVSSQSNVGTAKRGSTITISISTGRSTVEIPSVVGYDEASARSTLEDAGFYVSSTTEHSNSVAEGVVISQSRSGSTSSDDMSITIVVSSGPEQTTPTTPTTPDTPATDDGETDIPDLSGDDTQDQTQTDTSDTPTTDASTEGDAAADGATAANETTA